jgi:hypothetical protein
MRSNEMAPIYIVTTSVRALIVNSLTSIKSLASLRVAAYSGAAVFNESC